MAVTECLCMSGISKKNYWSTAQYVIQTCDILDDDLGDKGEVAAAATGDAGSSGEDVPDMGTQQHTVLLEERRRSPHLQACNRRHDIIHRGNHIGKLFSDILSENHVFALCRLASSYQLINNRLTELPL